MSDETENPKESKIFNMSVRAWVLMIVVLTVCIMSVFGLKVEEPLYTLVGSVMGFYFGDKKKN